MKKVLRVFLAKGKGAVVVVVTALTLVSASAAWAGSGVGGVFNLGVTNSVAAITTLMGSVAGPSVRIDNNSTNTAARALDLQVEAGKAPMRVNSTTKVAKLNSDSLDGKSVEQLSRVGQMTTDATLPLTDRLQAYGGQMSITAPTSGFVRVNGNVTVINSGCTNACQFYAYTHHIQKNNWSMLSVEAANPSSANASLDAVFPVDAGVNTFDISLYREYGENGTLYAWLGTLTGEYTPYGSTGTGVLSASGARASSDGPVDKPLP
jgi:hypothetical protein